MKAGTMIASTFLTVGILIVGFFAPEAVTAVVDRRLETETAEFETDSVQVESMEEMSDVLQLVGSGYISFELEYGVVREKSEMEELEQKAVESLADAGLVAMRSFSYHDEYPLIAISYYSGGDMNLDAWGYETGSEDWENAAEDMEREYDTIQENWGEAELGSLDEEGDNTQDENAKGSTAAVLWQCQLSNAQGDVLDLMIDDRSGKAVSFSWQKGMTDEEKYRRIESFETNRTEYDQKGEAFLQEMMQKAGSFCEEYYELKLQDTVFEKVEPDAYETVMTGYLAFEDSRGSEMIIPFQTMMDGSWYQIN